MKFYVYSLVREGEDCPFYIGCTCSPKRRRWQHSQRIALRGVNFNLVILETCDNPTSAGRLERDLIFQHLQRGVKLLNAPHAPKYTHPQQMEIHLRAEKAARRERQLRLEAESEQCREKLAEKFADGSAQQAIAAFLATQKALLTANDEEAAKISAAYFTCQRAST